MPHGRKTRDTRVLRYLPLVRKIAKRAHRPLPQIDVDDLVSAGTIGLIEAADRYDAKLGVPFVSFAYRRIKGAIIDEVSRFVPSRTSPTAKAEQVSLEAPIAGDASLTLLDVTADRLAPEPDRGVELTELLDAMRRLPPREREMLRLSAAGHSVKEIALLHGCSESLASQLLLQARFRLEERTAA
jgi:RNA polymerase sigma factor (sigma-70 family)